MFLLVSIVVERMKIVVDASMVKGVGMEKCAPTQVPIRAPTRPNLYKLLLMPRFVRASVIQACTVAYSLSDTLDKLERLTILAKERDNAQLAVFPEAL